jgi:hypothetical protein
MSLPQRRSPVLRSKHRAWSFFSDSPLDETKTRSPETIGVEELGPGSVADQRMLSVLLHSVGKFVSPDVPL